MTYTILDPEPNSTASDDSQTEVVQNFLELIAKNERTKREHDNLVLLKRAMYDAAASGRLNKYPKFVNHKLIYQSAWQTLARMKILDYTLHAQGRKDWQRAAAIAGMQTVMDKGGLYELWRGKNGIAFNMLIDGDCFVWVQKNPAKGKPVSYNIISSSNLYVDFNTLGFRGLGEGREATKAAIVFEYTWATFCRLWPEFKDKVRKGRIPREKVQQEAGRDVRTPALQDEDVVEICYGYDIDNGVYCAFAGANCTILEQLEGAKYPAQDMNGQNCIPVIQFFGIPAASGFFNWGLVDVLWDLAEVQTKLKNMEIGHVWENTWPIVNLSMPQEFANQYVQNLAEAYQRRANGMQGVVVNGYDKMNPYKVESSQVLTQNMASEWQMIDASNTKEIERAGIVLDSGDLGSDPTRYQLMAEEDRKTLFVKKMLEDNASNCQALYEMTIKAISKIKRSDKTPLNIRVDLELTPEDQAEDLQTAQEAQGVSPMDAKLAAQEAANSGVLQSQKLPRQDVEALTIGWLAGEFKDHNYFVDIDARSGAYTSELAELAKYEGFLANVPPGSVAQTKILEKITRGKGINVKGVDFNAPVGPNQAESAPTNPLQ